MNKRFFLFLTVLFFFLPITACKRNYEIQNSKIIGTSNDLPNMVLDTKKDKKLLLVSFTILKDMVKNIVGDEYVVESITKPGMEVHGYQVTPSDLVRGSKAIIFIENGFGFELWAEKFISNLNVDRVTIANSLEPVFIREDVYKGKPNPHAWISPKRGTLYVDILLEALTKLDPENKLKFEKNAKLFKNKIKKIDEDFSLFLNTLKKSERYLVSCEGAFSYLTNDYGLNELYLWPVNAESQVTPKRMARVINLVKGQRIPAVFCESTVSAESQLSVAKETGAVFGGNLYVDSLSDNNGPANTYLNMLIHNLETIKKGFNSSLKN